MPEPFRDHHGGTKANPIPLVIKMAMMSFHAIYARPHTPRNARSNDAYAMQLTKEMVYVHEGIDGAQMYNVLIPIPRSSGGELVLTLTDVGSSCRAVPLRLVSFLAAFCAAFLSSSLSRAVTRFFWGPCCF